MKHKFLYFFVGLVFGVILSWMAFPFFKNAETAPIPRISRSIDYAEHFLEGIDEFGPLKMGEITPYGEGKAAPFDDKDIPKSKFYIYVKRRGISLCEFESCSVTEGRIVACMGGWLSGNGYTNVSNDMGLDLKAVSEGRASIVVLADKKSKIIGIYPNHTEGDILEILGQHPRYEESFKRCVEEELGDVYY